MGLGDRFKRRNPGTAAGPAPTAQGWVPPAPVQAQQFQQPPPGCYWDGQQWVPVQAPAPQPIMQQPQQAPPQFIQQQQAPVQAPVKKQNGTSLWQTIIPLVIVMFMTGGVIGCAYFAFIMKPWVSTTVIKWMPALMGLQFLMTGIGLFGLYLKRR